MELISRVKLFYLSVVRCKDFYLRLSCSQFSVGMQISISLKGVELQSYEIGFEEG